MSTLYVDNLQPNLGSRVMAAGHVVQVVSAELTSLGSVTGNAWQTIMSANITPTSSSSKIVVVCNGNFGHNGGSGWLEGGVRTLSSETGAVSIGDADSSRTRCNQPFACEKSHAWNSASLSWTVTDSPATTSQVTYSMQVYGSEGDTVYYNRTQNADNQPYVFRGACTITLMEIAQ
jgi:hypothetical protein